MASRRRRRIKKNINFLDIQENKDHSLSIYTDIKKFKFCSENILLLGLLKDYPGEEDYENKSRYGDELFKFCKDNIKYTDNPSEADIFILPYKFKNIDDIGYRDMVKLATQYDKKLLCFHNDDDDKTYNLDKNVILYRTSFYKSKQLENEKAMTVFVVDHFKNNYLSDLSVSFCGTIFNKGIREKVLNKLTNSDIKTDFILRTENGNDWNTGQNVNERKKQFFENIENNLMVFCNRGYGNFSYRFYETLMMGRIPLLIDSDCVFPFEDEININDIALVIDEKDINNEQYLIDKIKDFYEKNKDDIIDIQKNCRKIWEKYYSPFGFVKTMIKKYGNQGRTIYYGKDIEEDNQKTAIVISSTSKFKYIWHTFLYRLRKYWPDCPYQIYFTSDGDCQYLVDKYKINVFQQKSDLGFLEGYRYVCHKISYKYKYFILLQDDFLIEKDVKQNILAKYEDIMENNNFGFIRIMPCPGPKGERKKFGDIELGRINKNEDYSFSYQTSLWKLDYFLRITDPPIPRWDDFNMSRKMKLDKNTEELWGFIRPFKEWNAVYKCPIPYRPTAILKGKLLDWAKPLMLEDIKFEGQAGQDKFVANMTNFKTNGTFLEIGADHPKNINNTYYLEKALDWKGLMIEIRKDRYQILKNERSKSIPVIADATTIDYKQLFEKYKMPKNIDYLQLDLEATNGSTLRALQKLDQDIMDEYKFATITFEHDIWTGNKHELRRISREIFHKRGYFLVISDIHNSKPEYVFEDWYIHPDLIDIELAKKIKTINDKFYVKNKITNTSIDYKDIIY